MKKVAILTSGILPVPAVKGGAVENLVDIYMQYNADHKVCDITVFSIADSEITVEPSDVNHYRFIDTTSFWARLKKQIFRYTHRQHYYHYTMEFFVHEALKLMKKEKYDVVVMENRPAYVLRLDGIDSKVVYHIHNDILNDGVAHATEIYERASKILTVSRYIKKRVETVENLRSGSVSTTDGGVDKVVVVNNGIDINLFDYNKSADKAEIRKALGLSADDFVLVFSGRVTKEKGVMQLIQAMQRLHHIDNIKLLIIGSSFFANDTTEDPFFASLRREAETMKDRVIFTGFQPYQRIPLYLAAADVAVIPSIWHDPFPTTVLEAQAMALPIITTRQGGIPEEVGDNAIMLDADENEPMSEEFIDGLASAIEELYTNPQRCRQLADASRQRAHLYRKDDYARIFLDEIIR